MDSNQLEEEESFDISLFRNGLHNNIHIGPQSITTITIRDDDSKVDSKTCFSIPSPDGVTVILSAAVEVGLTQTNYRVEEGGTLTEIVCAKVFGENGECIVPLPFFVVFTTSDGRGKTFCALSSIIHNPFWCAGICLTSYSQLIHLKTALL